jgi:tetratricopeptide (TPR) repeat protein
MDQKKAKLSSLTLFHCLSLVFIFSLSAFYFSMNSGFNSVDDLNRVNGLDNAGPLNILHQFFPDDTSYYYRPLGRLTFFWDRDVWGSIASFMHLENILIHIGSAILVLLITRRVALLYSIDTMLLPLSSALLFGVHPITSEAVCWISGRYDLLAGFFTLLTVYMLLRSIQCGKGYWLALGFLALLAACLAKEVAVFALPGLLWLGWVLPDSASELRHKLQAKRFVLLAPTLGVVCYFAMRHAATAHDSGVSTALKGVTGGGGGAFEILDKFRVALKIYGFYFKKLFVPWPLNFGIVEISGWYVCFGIILLAVLFYFAYRRDVVGALGLTAFMVLSPALLVVFGRMAWTPIAERYMYIPTGLSMPAISILVYQQWQRCGRVQQKILNVLSVLVFVAFFITTLHRSWIWQDNERLYRDTVQKSPNFPPAKAELASALTRKGKIEEARVILASMQDGKAKSYIVDDLNLARILIRDGNLSDAKNKLLELYAEHPKKRYEILQLLLKVNAKQIDNETETQGKVELQKQSLGWLFQQKDLKPSAFVDYRIGKMQLMLGQEQEAANFFRSALDKAPEDAFYRQAAIIMLEKIEAP